MRALLLALLLAASAVPGAARAQAPADLVVLEVLPGWGAAEGRHVAGLRLTLAPGWKTYWRAPGPAGLPPAFDFAASTGITAAEPAWPTPEVFGEGEARTIGYGGEVTIPLDVALDVAGGGPARLAGTIDIGVCREVCVPVSLAFAADLPAEGRRHPAIVAALVDRPLTPAEAGARAACEVVPSPGGEGLALTVRVTVAPLGPEEMVAIESSDPALRLGQPVTAREGGALVARAEVFGRDGGPPAALDRSRLRVTVLGGDRAVDFEGCPAG